MARDGMYTSWTSKELADAISEVVARLDNGKGSLNDYAKMVFWSGEAQRRLENAKREV